MRELKLDGECFLLAEQHLILESHSKYFDKSSEYYEANLTDTERRIAYNYEMQNALNVGNNGKISINISIIAQHRMAVRVLK